MAVTSTITNIKLQIQVETGDTKNGQPVLKNLNFNRIRSDANADQLMEAGKAIANLQTMTLSNINSISTNNLTETT